VYVYACMCACDVCINAIHTHMHVLHAFSIHRDVNQFNSIELDFLIRTNI